MRRDWLWADDVCSAIAVVLRLANGLEDAVHWYIENRPWVDEVSAHFDRHRRLGLAN